MHDTQLLIINLLGQMCHVLYHDLEAWGVGVMSGVTHVQHTLVCLYVA